MIDWSNVEQILRVTRFFQSLLLTVVPHRLEEVSMCLHNFFTINKGKFHLWQTFLSSPVGCDNTFTDELFDDVTEVLDQIVETVLVYDHDKVQRRSRAV